MTSWTVFVRKCSQEPEESLPQVGRKRAAPRGRGRGRGSTAKRGRKTDIASIQSMMMNKDDDSEDEPPKKAPPRVSESHKYYRFHSAVAILVILWHFIFGYMFYLILVNILCNMSWFIKMYFCVFCRPPGTMGLSRGDHEEVGDDPQGVYAL
jgi:hypothetical protein